MPSWPANFNQSVLFLLNRIKQESVKD